jgi:RimJ/RimL family protein N-acetyltransferase
MMISYGNLKVYLNTLSAEDAKPIEENINDPEVIAGISNPTVVYPYLSEHAEKFIEFAIHKYLLREEFHLGIHLVSGELIGMCAIFNIDNVNRNAEIGYWVGKKHWRQGYAKESLRLAISFCFNMLKLHRVYAKVLTGNVGSIKLLESLKFSNEGIGREDAFQMGKFQDEFRFGLLEQEFAQLDIDVVDYQ